MKRLFMALWLLVSGTGTAQNLWPYSHPMVRTNQRELDTIGQNVQLALGHFAANIRPYRGGLLKEEAPCLFAGIEYFGPWTRDASVNLTKGGNLLFPEVARNTLLSQIRKGKRPGTLAVNGQYWDCMILSQALWQYVLLTGDRTLLDTGLQALSDQIRLLEEEEFDPAFGLFRGGSFFNDGVSAYPDRYTATGKYEGGEWVSDITKWATQNPGLKHPKGHGLPMMALSTNCLYYKAYQLLDSLESYRSGRPSDRYSERAARLKAAINRHFWMEDKGSYRYLVDPSGNSDRQEGAGLAFAILYGIADAWQKAKIFSTVHLEPMGIPSLWPSFERYGSPERNQYGRHSGLIWPQVNGYWAMACLKEGKWELFQKEFETLSRLVFRDKQFREIYHPVSGEPWGGIQEGNDSARQVWKSTEVQVWGASAYLDWVFSGLAGMEIDRRGIRFSPCLYRAFEDFRILDLPYRQARIRLRVSGKGRRIRSVVWNGKSVSEARIPNTALGLQRLEIVLGD